MTEKNLPQVDLANYNLDSTVLSLVPASIAEKYNLIPIFKTGKILTIAMSDPKNILALDEVRGSSHMDLSIVVSDARQIKEAIAEYYGISGIVEDVVKNYKPAGSVKVEKHDKEEAPIVKLFNVILLQALRERASDIHIEPEHDKVRVRFRVDGVLHEEVGMPTYMHAPIVSRVKVLSKMDIAESRIPQDGRFEINDEERAIDFRVSTFPSAFGEKVVIRILDKNSMLYTLPDIGFSEKNLKIFRELAHKPHGIILITGPTGSGKSSTLYATLLEINNKEINIMTVEDPIEYELDGITQSQVNTKAGLTFASALRSILRQDPDVILVGEIRDSETAEIAIQSSLTGHLVFSTLHTNDSAGAVVRLVDMNIEPFLIASSLEGVMAQRLVRTICKKCKTIVDAPDEFKEKYNLDKMVKAQGCKACNGTGYKGRTGIFELLVIDEELRKMISNRASADDIRKYSMAHGTKSLFEDGLDKVRAQVTTLDEVLRVAELD